MKHYEKLKTLGERVRKIRISRGLSQTELAYKMGKDHPCINRLERGKSNPTVNFLFDLCEGLGVDVVELFKN